MGCQETKQGPPKIYKAINYYYYFFLKKGGPLHLRPKEPTFHLTNGHVDKSAAVNDNHNESGNVYYPCSEGRVIFSANTGNVYYPYSEGRVILSAVESYELPILGTSITRTVKLESNFLSIWERLLLVQ